MTHPAEKTMHQAQKSARTIELTNAEWSTIDTGIPDVIELLDDVRNVFFDLAYQEDLDQPGVNAMMRLAARAIKSMEDKELHALERLDLAIRHSRREGGQQ